MVPGGTTLGIIVVLGVVTYFADRRYRGRGVARRPTDEVFRDPASGEITRVWTDGRGERSYRVEGESAEGSTSDVR
jgi:hypothetical protein